MVGFFPPFAYGSIQHVLAVLLVLVFLFVCVFADPELQMTIAASRATFTQSITCRLHSPFSSLKTASK